MLIKDLIKTAAGNKMPDLSKEKGSITSFLQRDISKLDNIAKPALYLKQGDPKLNAALDVYLEQLKETITDNGNANLTPAGKRIIEEANKIADMSDFKKLQIYIANIILRGSGLGVVTEIEGLHKNGEQIVQDIIKAKIHR